MYTLCFNDEEIAVEVNVEGDLENVLIKRLPSCAW